MEINLGAYICTGCKIEESLDLTALSDVAKKEHKLDICKKHPALCSNEGLELIKKDIEEEGFKGIVIAACSPRVNIENFSFDNNIIIERVNLREQVIWCGEPDNKKDIQIMAEDYLRMAIVKAKKIKISDPYVIEELNSDILVVGAGITGITAAIEGAKAGYNIILVEKEQEIGGWSNALYKQLPTRTPYTDYEEPVIKKKLNEIKGYSNIKIYSSARITEISGEPGNFKVEVTNGKDKKHMTVASIITALGWKPYDPYKLNEFGYRKLNNVITNIEFEEMAKSGIIRKPSDNKVPESVLFIQCAGSRSKDHLPYCSSYCCGTTLKQAKYLRNISKDSSVFIVYKDIRTSGHHEYFYKEIQKDERIFLTKGVVKNISKENNKLIVHICNTPVEEQISLSVDLIVLATGMIPVSSEELNLKYRQGKGLPEIKYNFPDSHFICFPYETRRTGIYAAGTCRAPMDISGCIEDAMGAVLKSIQCINVIKKGGSVHPRTGDKSYPDLYIDRCTDCKRCTEECPFGVYDETDKGAPLPNINRCRRCGICLGSCPERVINFYDYSVNIVSEMIKAACTHAEYKNKPRILAFVCENDAYPAFDMAGYKRFKYSPYIRIIPVRCIGSINAVWISDALSNGFDGILQIGCKPGEDYQCHFIQGSELIQTRTEYLKATLSSMMLEPERIKTEFIEINDYHKIPGLINQYIKTIEKIGPNPYKNL